MREAFGHFDEVVQVGSGSSIRHITNYSQDFPPVAARTGGCSALWRGARPHHARSGREGVETPESAFCRRPVA
jgi:hypothetical protein